MLRSQTCLGNLRETLEASPPTLIDGDANLEYAAQDECLQRPKLDSSMQTDKQKRTLKFDDFDSMMVEVRSLLDSGYSTRGNWTLGQACSHIADWMRFPVDGFPRAPLPVRFVMWVMKHTIAPGMKRKILAEGFKGGIPTAPETVPEKDQMTDQQGAEKLQETVTRVLSYPGDLQPSPLFGPMDKETLIKVSLLHAEHHLGYLEPRARGE